MPHPIMPAALLLLLPLGCMADQPESQTASQPTPALTLTLEPIATVRLGAFLSGAAEIVAHDPASQRLFVVNGADNTIEILSFNDPARMVRIGTIDMNPFGGGVNSVAVHNGLVATAIGATVRTDPGRMALFDISGNLLASVEVGALPDMVCFTPDGRRILTANEGEPSDDYSIDPEGSVSIIELPADPRQLGPDHVRTADFRRFNDVPIHPEIRIFGPGASVAQDLEPEYIAVCPDSITAYVVLQENNALAVVDLESAAVTELISLGYKDHSLPDSGFDASDRDERINIRQWPVFGLYQPDTIRMFVARDGRRYLVTADEGDTRGYPGFDETARVRDLKLDPEAFPDAAWLQENANLGRLTVARTMGDDNADGQHQRLFAFGGRGFSIRETNGQIVFESGDEFEHIIARQTPTLFNTDNAPDATFKNRSDNRGPEPEALAIGRVGERDYAFIGLERTGGIMVYDITQPVLSRFVHYWTNRDHTDIRAQTGDLGPECLIFITAEDSPTGQPLLVSANEISGTVTVMRLVINP